MLDGQWHQGGWRDFEVFIAASTSTAAAAPTGESP